MHGGRLQSSATLYNSRITTIAAAVAVVGDTGGWGHGERANASSPGELNRYTGVAYSD